MNNFVNNVQLPNNEIVHWGNYVLLGMQSFQCKLCSVCLKMTQMMSPSCSFEMKRHYIAHYGVMLICYQLPVNDFFLAEDGTEELIVLSKFFNSANACKNRICGYGITHLFTNKSCSIWDRICVTGCWHHFLTQHHVHTPIINL